MCNICFYDVIWVQVLLLCVNRERVPATDNETFHLKRWDEDKCIALYVKRARSSWFAGWALQ